jgi:diguanylate cyclase (GGDEF)-like protein
MRIYRPSLRVAMTVPIALLFAATMAVQTYTQQEQVKQLIDRSSVRLLDALTSSSHDRLAEFLDEPFRIQRDIGDAIARHSLYKKGDLGPIYRHIRSVYQDLYLDRRQMSFLSFGSRSGEFAGLRREAGNAPFTLVLKDDSTRGLLTIYQGDSPGKVIKSFPDYDPRLRPWYAPAAQSGQSGWSAIYANNDERAEITISASSPVRIGKDLLGVMEADVKLDGLNRFLRDEPLRGKGLLFIADLEGRLVAHSEAGSVVSDGTGAVRRGERLLIAESSSPQIRAVAQHVLQTPASSGDGFKITVGGELYFCRVSPYSDSRGLNWKIVALVPETDLMGEARAASQRAMMWSVGFSLLGLLLVLWVISWVTGSIHRTAEAATRLSLGDWETSIDQADSLKETTILMRAFNEMANRLQHSFNHMREQVIRDSLTQLLTRRGLLERVDGAQHRPAVLSLVGLDAFRAINDNVGYGTGDRLLQAIAERMRERLPSSALVARVGGDEFALLHTDVDAENPQAAIVEKVLALFATPFAFGADEVMITASVGVVGGQLDADTLPEWLRNASVALGEAKRRGRGHGVVFEAGMMEQSMRRARLASDLSRALEKQQLHVHYQPVVDLASGRVTGAEALMRWQSPERGMVSPSVFIPAAEESDLILTLGDWILRSATRDIGQRLPQLPKDFELHVNLSTRQLIQSDFVHTLQQALHDSGLPARHLTLELTESQLIEQDSVTEGRLHDIRAMGVKIAIDDFGTGYSSLSYLSRLPFDCLKIDQSFVRKLSSSSQDTAIVAAVLHMADGFGVSVVAEGVETLAEARSLRQMGCGQVQGYYFGRPAPLAQFDWNDRSPP